MTEDRLRQICAKYGSVFQCTLKTRKVEGGQTVSRGIAEVVYSNKDEAAVAIQKLYFEDELGRDV